jgi:paraquat-inducible protein A
VNLPVAGAAGAGILGCDACGLAVRPAAPAHPGHCPRCGIALERRRPDAIQRTWALVIAAAILYVPANLLPVLVTDTLVSSEADTIMSGVVFLYTSGSWPLALIVLVSVQLRSTLNRRQRTQLYRTVEFIGRWSMLDVFVDTFVVALVQLSPLMSVQPGPGVVYFMGVVVLTMFAARSFDPRLVWDAAADAAPEAAHGRR